MKSFIEIVSKANALKDYPAHSINRYFYVLFMLNLYIKIKDEKPTSPTHT